MGGWHAYDHYLYAAAALVGTLGGAWAVLRLAMSPRGQARLEPLHGVVPPFINILGVLFGLTLAFLANDTWGAHDRAIAAINRETDALRSIVVLSRTMPAAPAASVRAAVADYGRAARDEWPELARQSSAPSAAAGADRLLGALTTPEVASGTPAPVLAKAMDLAIAVRDARETRLALSQTHVNPLKWAGMAFLGFMTMLSVALVHIGQPRAMAAAVWLFALASAPTAVILLIHGNPFQPPAAVTPLALENLLEDLGGR